MILELTRIICLLQSSGPGCSKLTMSLVNVFVKISNFNISGMPMFLLKECERLLHCGSFSHFFKGKYRCIWL